MWNLKNNTNELIYKTDSQIWKTNLWLPKGKGQGKGQTEVWDRPIPTIEFKTDNQQGPTMQHRELCSIFCKNQNGTIIWKGIDTYICITKPFCCILYSNTKLFISNIK